VIFCVQDNGYAISVPVEVQTAGGSISRLVSGFPNFHFEEVDGTDPVVAYAAFERAAAHCRGGHGPAFVHAHVIRPYSHSLSDDERLYRPDSERQADAARDPVHRLQLFLLREGILDEKGINKIEKEVEEQLQAMLTGRSKRRLRSRRRSTTLCTRRISIRRRRCLRRRRQRRCRRRRLTAKARPHRVTRRPSRLTKRWRT